MPLSGSLSSLYTVFFVLLTPNCQLLLMVNHVSYYRHGQDWSVWHLCHWSCTSGNRHSSICLLSKGFTACYTASIEENWFDLHWYSHLKEGLGTLKVPSRCTGWFFQVYVGLVGVWKRDPSRQPQIQISLANPWVRKGILKSSLNTVVSVTAADSTVWELKTAAPIFRRSDLPCQREGLETELVAMSVQMCSSSQGVQAPTLYIHIWSQT